MVNLSYPIGQAQLPEGALTPAERTALIQQLADLPAQLTAVARAVGGVGLERPYRPGGWNGRQVIHHLADSHLNSYCRFRLALTEQNPTVCPYDEQAWAELPDVAATPITVSLTLLEALHTRWVTLLHHLSDEQWQRTFYHPGTKRDFTLDQALALYAWHGQHHLAHLKALQQ
ncbi:putative metal-dependent hydrolase [Hymenobacter sp. BT770]|uniref:YfiT family bacillithiol transferase n=1 Tax=Hymenobacter sp. BT770 TaxID=2886942 RepID=UPI001D109165|nr:putative metal-dependent hydrolase [Hymenobacter sp. BT770]MCC3152215.1 putative metal-dependent hydrolase [Hymenobacter sp. BT770]MDO3414029.1 putative metal-dependent hydrolase [Hymenobacter sp. BT770]